MAQRLLKGWGNARSGKRSRAHMEADLHPTPHNESVPILLVRPVVAEDEVEEAASEPSVPCSRSVPPRAPPAAIASTETDLPSVIVDLATFEAEERAIIESARIAEKQRDSDVDILLDEAEAIEVRDAARVPTLHSVEGRESSRWRTFAVALVALALVGGTVVEMRAHGLSARAVGAALRLR
jgi:hypothetical protein